MSDCETDYKEQIENIQYFFREIKKLLNFNYAPRSQSPVARRTDGSRAGKIRQNQNKRRISGFNAKLEFRKS